MTTYRILSMDGGGVRGIITARFLQKIVARYPEFLDKVNLYAGTSAGSINAVGLAQGLTPETLVELYQQQSALIFQDTLWHDVGHLWGMSGAKYTAEGRHDALAAYIEDMTLEELRAVPRANNNVHVMIPTYQLDSDNTDYQNNPAVTQTLPLPPSMPDPSRSWKAKFFHNFTKDNTGEPNPDLNQKSLDVVLRSSAAPTFFPIYQGFVDGGVVANNPSLCALTQAINTNTGGQKLQDVVMLSIGTGGRKKFLLAKNNDWGLAQWGLTLVDLLMESGQDLANYQSRQLLADCYSRLDAQLQIDIGLDAVALIPQMIAIVDEMEASGGMDGCFQWIEAQWLP